MQSPFFVVLGSSHSASWAVAFDSMVDVSARLLTLALPLLYDIMSEQVNVDFLVFPSEINHGNSA